MARKLEGEVVQWERGVLAKQHVTHATWAGQEWSCFTIYQGFSAGGHKLFLTHTYTDNKSLCLKLKCAPSMCVCVIHVQTEYIKKQWWQMPLFSPPIHTNSQANNIMHECCTNQRARVAAAPISTPHACLLEKDIMHERARVADAPISTPHACLQVEDIMHEVATGPSLSRAMWKWTCLQAAQRAVKSGVSFTPWFVRGIWMCLQAAQRAVKPGVSFTPWLCYKRDLDVPPGSAQGYPVKWDLPIFVQKGLAPIPAQKDLAEIGLELAVPAGSTQGHQATQVPPVLNYLSSPCHVSLCVVSGECAVVRASCNKTRLCASSGT
eukprot:1162131-Pelagomonas_calceolata.AAC.7